MPAPQDPPGVRVTWAPECPGGPQGQAGGWTPSGDAAIGILTGAPTPNITQDLVQPFSTQGLPPRPPHPSLRLQPNTCPSPSTPASLATAPCPPARFHLHKPAGWARGPSGLPSVTAPSQHGPSLGSLPHQTVLGQPDGQVSVRLSVPAAGALFSHHKALNTHAKSLSELKKTGQTQKSWKRKQTTRETYCCPSWSFFCAGL